MITEIENNLCPDCMSLTKCPKCDYLFHSPVEDEEAVTCERIYKDGTECGEVYTFITNTQTAYSGKYGFCAHVTQDEDDKYWWVQV